MELITSGETLDFLSKSAPRAWIKRMLLWMIFTDEIGAYFLEARSIAKTQVFTIIFDALKVDASGPKREALIREHFDAEMAEKLIAANQMDQFEEIAHEWGRDEEPGVETAIEDLFEPALLNTKVHGKAFDRTNHEKDGDKFYSKFTFATKVVASSKNPINYDGFEPLLQAILDVQADYAKRVSAMIKPVLVSMP